MTTVNVTTSNFRKGLFKNVRTALLNVHADIGTKVYGSYPKTNISLPLIVVENAVKGESVKSLKGNLSYPGVAIVSVYAKKAEKIDVYADAIEAALWDTSATLYSNNLYLQDIFDNGNTEFEDINGNQGHGKSLSVMFHLK